jgi:membrane-associated phospholipid phosphatase
MLMQFFFDAFAINVILVLQQFPHILWMVLNEASGELVFIALLATTYWCINKKEGKIAVNLLMFSSFINILLKYAFAMPRPDPSLRPNPEHKLDTSYGFPSGAVQNATTFWGWASVKVRRWSVWLVSIVMVVITALARMGLGMHWLGDVIGGACIGIVIVVMAVFIVPFLLERWDWLPRALQSLIFPILALVFFGVFAFFYHLYPLLYFPTENVGVSMGVVFGFGVGAALEDRYIKFSTDIPRNTRIIRVVVGLVVATILYFALTALFGLYTLSAVFVFTLRFIKYVLVGLFGAFLIPLLFKAIDH